MSKADALRLPEYLSHIIEAIERIHRYVSDMSEVDFLADEKTQDAVIRNFENIGEASRSLFTRIRPKLNDSIVVPRNFSNYTVAVNEKNMPNGVALKKA